MMNDRPLFSVIIPTYHRNDLLAKCLDCLAPGVQILPAEQYEVIVTDDGSQTTAQDMISDRYPWVKWVAAPHQGPATNRNNGSKYAQGKWLVFTDDDCLPDSQWLEAYSQAIFNQPDCLVFEGRTYVNSPRKSLAETAPINETGGYLWSCNLAIQKQLFESLGGFDSRFPYAAMEDVDLRLRLTKSGYNFSFIQLASVCHPWKYKGGLTQIKQHNCSTLIYLSIHPEQIHKINFNYYILSIFRSFFLNTIPGIFKYRMAGAKEACIEHIYLIKMAFILLLKLPKPNDN